MDFTQKKYAEFCKTLIKEGYRSITIKDFVEATDIKLTDKLVILRHDIDKETIPACETAQIEHDLGLKGSYYFRIPITFHQEHIKKIHSLGHEIGLHYETMDKAKGKVDKLKGIMEHELNLLRAIVPIDTVAMHGNPLTKFDNRDVWNHCQLADFNLSGEVYLSFDFNKALYYSDTGRTWEDGKFNVKDFIPTHMDRVADKPIIKTTDDLIELTKKENRNLYILIHPERWSKNFYTHSKYLLRDRAINSIKYVIMKTRSKKS